jgi:polyisoprenoid-binding protein YceI
LRLPASIRIAIPCLLLLSWAGVGQAQTGIDVTLDPGNTVIRWTLTDVLHTTHGTFKLKSGSIHLDPQSGNLTGLIVVDATSGESGNETRDRKMHKEFLESSRYPTITFRPTRLAGNFDPGKQQLLVVDGIFNLHGQDHPLHLNVTTRPSANSVILATHFDVPYVQWGIKDPSTFVLRVSKVVSIDIESAAHD